MLIIIPAYLWDTRLHVAALAAAAAASVDSCTLVVASRSNSLPLIGCERAAISCTRMAHENGLHLLLWDRAPIIIHPIVIPASATLRSIGGRLGQRQLCNCNGSSFPDCRKCQTDGQGSCRSVSVSASLLSPLSLSLSFSPYLQLYLYRFLYLGAIVKLPGATIRSRENTQSFLLIYLSTCILWMQQLQIQIQIQLHACCALVFYFYCQLIYLERDSLAATSTFTKCFA